MYLRRGEFLNIEILWRNFGFPFPSTRERPDRTRNHRGTYTNDIKITMNETNETNEIANELRNN